MKKILLIISPRLLILLFIISGVTACKKNHDDDFATEGKLSFNFNGNKYTISDLNGEWGLAESGIYINRPDLFNGIVHFPRSACAHLEPAGLVIDRNNNCELTVGGTPVDSAAIHLFKSGVITTAYSNCRKKSGTDLFTGAAITYSICDLAGTFDLTLQKKGGNTIVISEGKLEKNNIRR